MAWFQHLRILKGRHLAVLLLLVCQVHTCFSKYVRESGETCRECVALPDQCSGTIQLSVNHGDCHDCCELTSCESPHSFAKVTGSSPGSFEIPTAILSEVAQTIAFPQAPDVWQTLPFEENSPSTGPPSVPSSRGPPQFLHIA